MTVDLAADLTHLDGLTAKDGMWAVHLHYRNRTPKTIRNYLQAVAQLAAYRRSQGQALDAADVTTGELEAFFSHVLTRASASTAATRMRQLRPLFRYLHEDVELIPANPMHSMKNITVEERLVDVPADDDIAALIQVCERDKTFEGRRDLAILRMFTSSGGRLEEIASIQVSMLTTALRTRSIRVLGKGQRERDLLLSDKAYTGLLKYLNARKSHPNADEPWLWISAQARRNGRLTDSGIYQVVKRRCRQARISELHPHQLRHWWAMELKHSGVNHSVLKTLGGWRDDKMPDRYGKAAEARIAADVHRSIAPGDRF